MNNEDMMYIAFFIVQWVVWCCLGVMVGPELSTPFGM